MFSTLLENFLALPYNLKLSSANRFSLEESKICRLGKGYTKFEIQNMNFLLGGRGGVLNYHLEMSISLIKH